MVSIISDMLHYETVIPEWKALFSNHLNSFTERKVEVFHSMLRINCSSWSTAEQIEEIAKVLTKMGIADAIMSEKFRPFFTKSVDIGREGRLPLWYCCFVKQTVTNA